MTGAVAGAGEGLMVSLTGPQGTVAAVPDFVEDTSSELERKSKALSVMALFESVTYCVLFYFWIISPSVAGKALAGFVHGLPVGISFIGRAWSEPKLISLAYAYEQATKHRRPPTFPPTIKLP